jgi:hypothetical protein
MVDTRVTRALMARVTRIACERVWHLTLRGIDIWELQQRHYWLDVPYVMTLEIGDSLIQWTQPYRPYARYRTLRLKLPFRSRLLPLGSRVDRSMPRVSDSENKPVNALLLYDTQVGPGPMRVGLNPTNGLVHLSFGVLIRHAIAPVQGDGFAIHHQCLCTILSQIRN